MGHAAKELSALLQAGARGDYSEEAAVGLLVGHRTWLQRWDFVSICIIVATAPGGRPMAFVNWHAAVRALDAGELPCSTSEASVLRIAAGLGGTSVDLRLVIGGLDAENVLLVARAVMHANGTPVETLPTPSATQPARTALGRSEPSTSPEEGRRHG